MNAAAAHGRGTNAGIGALLASPGVLSILFWGASFVATRRALDGYTPAGLVAVRFLLGSVVVAGVALARGVRPWPKREDFGRSALLGLVLAGHILLQAFALRFTSAIHSGWIVSFSAVGVTLGSAFVLGERLPARNWVGVGLAALGVACVVLSHSPEFAEATTGDLLVLTSSVTWAVYTLMSKRPIVSSGAWRVTPFVLGLAGLVAGAFALEEGVRAEGASFCAASLLEEATLAVGFLGVAASGLAFIAWAATIERFGALRAGLLVYLQPFVTLVLSVLLLGESAGWGALIGGPIVLVGVAWASRGAAAE